MPYLFFLYNEKGGNMKIVLDAFGGDNAPEEIVKGGISALEKDKELELIMVGRQDIVKELIKQNDGDLSRIEIVDATEVIGMEETPTVAIRQKKDSSLVKAFKQLSDREDVGGLVSAGSTGAVLTGAVLKVGRIPKISRPALAPILPKLSENGGGVVLIDCGANADCKPVNLCHFALMGKCYAEIYLGIENPRIALLNIGQEEHKGGELQKEAYKLLSGMNINFVGNVEGRDMLNDACDVIVSDGFSGNIALKTCEGSAMGLLGEIKGQISKGGLKAKLGALLLKDVFKSVKKKMDYNEIGGAAFLGVKKVVIKAHGSSQAKSIATAILQAKRTVSENMIGKIQKGLETAGVEIDNA